MQKEDYFIILVASILATSLIYFYQNLSSFECFMQNSTQNVMSDITYSFEPNGSLYGKVKIYRLDIASNQKDIEYYGMTITDSGGNQLFSEIDKDVQGGSITATLTINETSSITVRRFFKRKCYAEVQL